LKDEVQERQARVQHEGAPRRGEANGAGGRLSLGALNAKQGEEAARRIPRKRARRRPGQEDPEAGSETINCRGGAAKAYEPLLAGGGVNPRDLEHHPNATNADLPSGGN
jgi:hypothetical protein